MCVVAAVVSFNGVNCAQSKQMSRVPGPGSCSSGLHGNMQLAAAAATVTAAVASV